MEDIQQSTFYLDITIKPVLLRKSGKAIKMTYHTFLGKVYLTPSVVKEIHEKGAIELR